MASPGAAPEVERRLVALLGGVDVVSFDLFDTLVGRRGLLSPKDVFVVVADHAAGRLGRHAAGFPTLRARAEEAARARAWGAGLGEVTLDEIYAELAGWTGLDPEVVDELRGSELQAERDVVHALDSGRRLYDAVLAAGKNPVLVSDTYLPEAFVRELAERAGYHRMEAVYVSSSHRCSKLRGTLFDVLLRDLDCPPARVLHVGDDPASDVVPALGRGLKALHAPTRGKLWRSRHGVGNRPTGDRVTSAMLSRIADTPERSCPEGFRQPLLADIGERSLAPLLLGFSTWLSDRVRRAGHQRVFFAARDGLMMKQVFDLVSEAAGLAVETRYLYVSRASLYPALISCAPERARRLFSQAWDRLSVEAALRRLDLGVDVCAPVLRRHGLEHDLPLTATTLKRFEAAMEELWPLVASANEERASLVADYLRQEGVLDDAGDAFVDIGWHGTSQECLLRLRSMAGVREPMNGYYLGTFGVPAEVAPYASGYLAGNDAPVSTASLVRHSPSLLELLHGAAHGQVVGYRRQGRTVAPLLEDRPWERRQFHQTIEPVQRSAMAAVALSLGDGSPARPADPQVVSRASLRLLHDPTPREASVLGRLNIVTDVGGDPKSITGAAEWDPRLVPGRRLPDGTIPMWIAGREAMRGDGSGTADPDGSEPPDLRLEPMPAVRVPDRPTATREPPVVPISIVIPVRDAADTVAETLDSLAAQTFRDWEAIVVDDGSTDATAAAVTAYSERDRRIRLVRGRPEGIAGARNAGMLLANGEWLLFLDGDEVLLPGHIEGMLIAVERDADVDLAYCTWARVAPDGTFGPDYPLPEPAEVFEVLGGYCPFAVHCCMVRRSLVAAVGGFDPSVEPCEDWDLWQRVTRSGARLRPVPGPRALYRTRPGSASHDAARFLASALEVVGRGSRPDPRVRNPSPELAHGLPPDGLAERELLLVTWCAGLLIGKGEDPTALLGSVGDPSCPALSPSRVADNLFDSTPVTASLTEAGWASLWLGVREGIEGFLVGLEALSGAPDLARRALVVLQRRIVSRPGGPATMTLGGHHRLTVEVCEALPDVAPPPGTVRLGCRLTYMGEPLGSLELPVCTPTVPAGVLADAIASVRGWPILSAFLQRSSANRDASADGWELFLRELWARPGWPVARFYDPAAQEPPSSQRVTAGDDGIVVEVSGDVPDVDAPLGLVQVVPTVGGAALGMVEVHAREHLVRSQAIRAAITGTAGLELARAAVREGILGRADDGRALRQRLSDSAAARFGAGASGRAALPPAAIPMVRPTAAAPSGRATERLTILRYHRVAHRPPARWERSCVAPEAFAEQLAHLRYLGYRSLTLDEWDGERQAPGRCVAIGFDEAELEFAEEAWPILRRFGFTASLFVATNRVGSNHPPEGSMGWGDLRRLRDEGLQIGALPATGGPLTGLSPSELSVVVRRSRVELAAELGSPPDAFAYPLGDTDEAVRHLVGACGFTIGLTTRAGHAGAADDRLDLPSIEVSGMDSITDFLHKLEVDHR